MTILGQATRRQLFLDAALAVVAFGLTLLLLAFRGGVSRNLDPFGAGLAAVACLPLVARRRFPLGVFALTTAASAALNGLGYPLGPPVGPTVALFFLAGDEQSRGRMRQTATVVLVLFAVHVGTTAIAHRGFPTTPILFGILVWGVAWAVGDQLRLRRQRRFRLAERIRQAQHEVERERRLAVAEERTRIARDLHDSAAHAINVILVQAGAARLLQDRDSEAARAALVTIEEVARETIGEIERLIKGLRKEPDDGTQEPVELPPGLEALETLAERHRSAGLAVEICVEGRQQRLAPGLEQAAYRIIQESLTNAARHGAGSAQVGILFTKSELELKISNPIQSELSGETFREGHGILGMRERAELLGGTLEARATDGCFRVYACLPFPKDEKA